MECGVDVKRSHEPFLGVDAEGRHLVGMLVDEPSRKPEAEHGLPLFDLALFGIPVEDYKIW